VEAKLFHTDRHDEATTLLLFIILQTFLKVIISKYVWHWEHW